MNLCNAQVRVAKRAWFDFFCLRYEHIEDAFWREGYDFGWDAAARGEPCPEPYA